jgi:hypothetical protein
MKRGIKITALVLGGLLICVVAWGLIEPYFIDETSYAVGLPNLPDDWAGRQIATISDFQVGMWGDNLPTVRRVVELIVRRHPAAVLILGDFIYHGGENPQDRIETAIKLLRPLTEAQIDVIAVLGNHDYSVVDYNAPEIDRARAQRLKEALEEANVTVLENEVAVVESPSGAALHIAGIGSLMAQQSEPAVTLEKVRGDDPRVVIMHNPSSFGDLPPGTAHLALAGHTHGGQFRLPFTPSWTWVTFIRQEEVHADGWIKDYGAAGNRLYVNRGIGFSKIPMRLNCPPEITWLTLEAPDSEVVNTAP